MSEMKVLVHENGERVERKLDPAGTTIGRCEPCDIIINSRDVSRKHARLYQSRTGTWGVEDLNSSNGTFVNGERVNSATITKDDTIEIGPASLSFGSIPIPAKTYASSRPNIIISDFGTEVFYDKPRLTDCDQQPCPERLAQIRQRLSELTDGATLYKEVCALLAQKPKTAAAVFRVPREASSIPKTPSVLAHHFGSSMSHTKSEARRVGYPSHRAFRVSHRLLEAVCVTEKPLMSKTIFTCDTEVTLSLINEHSPRTLMCVPLGSNDQTMDLLYVDVPLDERSQPGPEEMFAFVQAVAEQIQHSDNRVSSKIERDH